MDDFTAARRGASVPARTLRAVSPSDTADLPTVPQSIFVGTAGDLKVVGADAPDGDSGVVLKNVPSGTILPISPRRVLLSGTTAMDIVGFYTNMRAYAPGAAISTYTNAPNVTAPVFAVRPSIGGVIQVGRALVGSETVIGANSVSWRWLRGSAVVSTAQAYLATDAGELTYEVTATGPGGITVDSTTVTVAAAAPRAPLAPIGMIGANIGGDAWYNSGALFPAIDLSKVSEAWFTDDNNDPATGQPWAPPTVDSRGYPIALNPHAGYAQCSIGIEGANAKPGAPYRYVIETTNTGQIDLLGGASVVPDLTGINNGVQRIVFDAPNGSPVGIGFHINVRIHKPFVAETDTFAMWRLDRENLFRSGVVGNPDYVAHLQAYNHLRWMDSIGTNNNTQTTLDQWRKPSASRWSGQVPLEVVVAITNQAMRPLWMNIPPRYSDAEVAKMAAYVRDHLDPTLPVIWELANEPWNFDAPFALTFAYFEHIRDGLPLIAGADSTNQSGYGWRAAQVMATVLKTFGYDKSRCRPFWNTKYNIVGDARGVLAGINYAIAEWANPASANPNAEFAAHFQESGQIFRYFGGQTYTFGDTLPNNALSSADTATRDAWSANNPADLTSFFTQFHDGSILTSMNSHNLNAIPSAYAGMLALSDEIQTPLAAYEGGVVYEGATGNFQNFAIAAMKDPRTKDLVTGWASAGAQAGYELMSHLADFGSGDSSGGPYGAIASYATPALPRQQGIVAAVTSPPAPRALTVHLVTTGFLRVGQHPVTRIVVSGGRGDKNIVVTGLAPGQTFDGFRNIKGTLTTAGTTTLSVTVTDDANPSNAPVTLVQKVLDVPALPTGQYVRFLGKRVAANGGLYYMTLRNFLFRTQGSDADIAATWTAGTPNSEQAPANAVSFLNNAADFDGEWTSNNMSNGLPDLRGVLPASTTIEKIVLEPDAVGLAPIAFQVWISPTPFAADGTGGTLVLDVNETDASKWQQNVRREFILGGSLDGTGIPQPPAPAGNYIRFTPTGYNTTDGSAVSSAYYGLGELRCLDSSGNTMTPIGYSSPNASNPAVNLGDGNPATTWTVAKNASDTSVVVILGSQGKPAQIYLHLPGDSTYYNTPTSFKLEYSSDGSNYTTVYTRSDTSYYPGDQLTVTPTYL